MVQLSFSYYRPLNLSLVIPPVVFTFLSFVTSATAARRMHVADGRPPSSTVKLYLLGDLQLDLDSRTSSVHWTIAKCDFRSPSADPPVLNGVHASEFCHPPDMPLAVYIADPSKPVFSYTSSVTLGVSDYLNFATEHRIHKYVGLSRSEQLMVSPDQYFFHTFAFAVDPTTNYSVPIAKLVVAGTTKDFAIRSHDTAAMNTLAYDPGKEPVSVESRVLRVEIEPSVIALANAIGLFAINWLATIGSIYVTVLVTSGKLKKDSVIATGPFGALLTIPTVRSFYIDSPFLVSPIESTAFFVEIVAVISCCVVLLMGFASLE